MNETDFRKYHIYVRKYKRLNSKEFVYALASNVCTERKHGKPPKKEAYIEITVNEKTGSIFISKDLFKG